MSRLERIPGAPTAAPAPHASLLVACLTLLAASLGAVAGPWPQSPPPSFAVVAAALPSPSEITEYTKAVVNAVCTVVNALVGCYHLIAIGRGHLQRRRRKRRKPSKPSPNPAPDRDPRIRPSPHRD